MSTLAGPSAEVPKGVTTRTSTLPLLVGAVALMKVGEITVKLEDSLAPKNTALVEENPLPMMLTVAPPPAETVEGDTAATTGSELTTASSKAGIGAAGDGFVLLIDATTAPASARCSPTSVTLMRTTKSEQKNTQTDRVFRRVDRLAR